MILQDISLAILNGMWTVIVWTWWIIVPIIIYFSRKNYKKAAYVDKTNHIVLSIKIPKNNDKGPVAAEMMFASLHGILQPKKLRDSGEVVQEHLSFEIVSTQNVIEFYAWVPEGLKDFVEGQIYAQYPTAEISMVEDYSKNIDIDGDNEDDCVAGTELSLVKDEIYPIKTFQNFDVDPLAAITGMLSKIEGRHEKVWIQILAKPIDDDWRDGSLGHIASKKGGKGGKKTISQVILDAIISPIHFLPTMIANAITPLSPEQKKKMEEAAKKQKEKEEKAAEAGVKLSHAEETELTAIEEKCNKLGYKTIIRIVYLAKSKDLALERVKSVYGAFKQFNTTNLNGFNMGEVYTGNDFLNSYRARLFDDTGFVLNIEEIASLYHLPHASVETPNIVWTSSKKGEPPANVPFIDLDDYEKDITPVAMTTFRSHFKPFGIKRDDRRRHMYVVGKSGTGKSRFIEFLAINDIKNGEGVAIIDPHGDLAERVLKFIPKDRIDDVIYFNPADRDFPVAFNPLESLPEQREEVANGFVSVMKKLFGYSWGPRLEYVLKHTVMALVEVEGSTMLGIVRMLTDKNFRKRIVEQITDPVVQMFWLKEFSSYNDKMATETISPILNKVGQFTSSPIIRNIMGQPTSTINFSKAMNEGKIMIFNLSTGLIGEENAKLIGSMVVTKLQLAAMSRAAIPEDERKDFYLYVDEFQNFATDSFAVILSEARKYRLSLIVANQYIAQMEETVRDAIFGNVGTLISFRVGATDASALEKEFTPIFEQGDLINLDNQHIYLTMLIDGVSSVPFSAMTLRSPEITNDLSAAVAAVSRKRYGTPRPEVEEAVRRWYNVDSVVAGVNANEKDDPIILAGRERKPSPEAVESSTSHITTERPSETPKMVEVSEEPKPTALIVDEDTESQKKKKRKRKKKSGTGAQSEALNIISDNTAKSLPEDVEKRKVIENLEATADYIVRHKDHDDKYVFLPENKPSDIVPDEKGRKKGTVYTKNGNQIYKVKIDMYEPENHETFGKNKAPDVWVGTIEETVQQLESMAEGMGGGTKFLGIEDKTNRPDVLQNIIKRKKERFAKEAPLRDKIDKESLEKIIREITVPKEQRQEEKPVTDKTINIPEKAIEIAETQNREVAEKPVEVAKEKVIMPIQRTAEENKPKEEAHKSISESNNTQEKVPEKKVYTFEKPEKTIKEITPDDFHQLKTIHPNEKVKISQDKVKELKPGEVVNFDS